MFQPIRFLDINGNLMRTWEKLLQVEIEMDQLDRPSDVIFDKKNNSLIICDFGNGVMFMWLTITITE